LFCMLIVVRGNVVAYPPEFHAYETNHRGNNPMIEDMIILANHKPKDQSALVHVIPPRAPPELDC
jgi:hypothetical protein